MTVEQSTTLGSNRRAASMSLQGVLWPTLALVAFVLGLVAGWFLPARAPGEGSPEVTFARDMEFHHAQAVEMSVIIRDRSEDDDLRTVALDIILTQRAQLGQFQGWLAVWGRPLTGAEPPMGGMGEMMGMASVEDLFSLQTLPVPEAEVRFLQLMIRHHQGGVIMAEDILPQTQRDEVTRLASAIIEGQQAEITLLEALLARRGAEPLPPLEPLPNGHGAH
jgi:uncharacterized protein (DUF305 family)